MLDGSSPPREGVPLAEERKEEEKVGDIAPVPEDLRRLTPLVRRRIIACQALGVGVEQLTEYGVRHQNADESGGAEPPGRPVRRGVQGD
jgi:hypothetical protein